MFDLVSPLPMTTFAIFQAFPAPTTSPRPQAASLAAVLGVTVLGSVSSGTFWAGLFFVTAQRYGFSVFGNLVLATVMGAVYALAARVAGRLAHGRVPRRVLSLALGTWTAAALLPLLFSGWVSALWIAALVGLCGLGDHLPGRRELPDGRPARRRDALGIGKFNVTWTPATALPLLLMPLVRAERHVGQLRRRRRRPALLALLAARGLPLHPPPHETEAAQAAVGPEYPCSCGRRRGCCRSATSSPPRWRRCCRTGWRQSASGTVGQLRRRAVDGGAVRDAAGDVAHAASGTGAGRRWAPPAPRWLARPGAGPAGAVAADLIAGLLVYGAGMGLTYYASLYYSMAVGHGAVEAGGNFEALIGVGYCVGRCWGSGADGGRSGPGRRGDGRPDLALHGAGRAGRGAPLSTVPPTALNPAGPCTPGR